MSKSVTQSEEEIKQRLINCLKDIEWDITQGKIDTVMTKLEEAQKLTQEWGEKNIVITKPTWKFPTVTQRISIQPVLEAKERRERVFR